MKALEDVAAFAMPGGLSVPENTKNKKAAANETTESWRLMDPTARFK